MSKFPPGINEFIHDSVWRHAAGSGVAFSQRMSFTPIAKTPWTRNAGIGNHKLTSAIFGDFQFFHIFDGTAE